jgi:hypothetical protein
LGGGALLHPPGQERHAEHVGSKHRRVQEEDRVYNVPLSNGLDLVVVPSPSVRDSATLGAIESILCKSELPVAARYNVGGPPTASSESANPPTYPQAPRSRRLNKRCSRPRPATGRPIKTRPRGCTAATDGQRKAKSKR